jgi:phosphoribosyl-ATP pyrophosphohydrolase/phosphoribosyl-AMP cyclohydrolase
MLGYFSRESMEKTLTDPEGLVTFWSRSRQELWTKGKTSGNFLQLVDMRYDCDSDALLILANPQGPTCHIPGRQSCFGDDEPDSVSDLAIWIKLEKLIQQRKIEMPEGSYTTKLFKAGIEKIAKKFGEEAVEVVIAALKESKERLISELADLDYHTMVLMRAAGVEMTDVAKKLESTIAKPRAQLSKVKDITQRFGNRAVKVVTVAMEGSKKRLVSELAEFNYDKLVLMRAAGVEIADVAKELERRYAPPKTQPPQPKGTGLE